MGLPVVGFATGGIPEAVVHGRTGVLSNECDVDALTDNLHTLLADDALRLQMAAAGREHVCRHFNLKTQTVALENIYHNVLHARPWALQSPATSSVQQYS
jgi:glycosyltransferase involved in cell wall biosynthesis